MIIASESMQAVSSSHACKHKANRRRIQARLCEAKGSCGVGQRGRPMQIEVGAVANKDAPIVHRGEGQGHSCKQATSYLLADAWIRTEACHAEQRSADGHALLHSQPDCSWQVSSSGKPRRWSPIMSTSKGTCLLAHSIDRCAALPCRLYRTCMAWQA